MNEHPPASTSIEDLGVDKVSVNRPRRWRERVPWLSGILTIVLICIAAVIVLVAVPRVLRALEGGQPWWVVAAAVCVVVSLGGFCLAFAAAYRGRGRLAGSDYANAALAQKGAATFLPGGQAGAAGAIAVVLRRTGMTAPELADRAIALLVLTHAPYFIGILAVGAAVGAGIIDLSVASGFLWTVTLVAGGVVVLGGAVAIFVRPVAAVAPAPVGMRARLGHLMHAGAGGVRSALALTRRPDAVVGTLIYITADCGALIVSMRIFGEHPPLASVIMAWLMAQVVSLIPVPGGVGTLEAGVLGTLVAFGQSAQAMAAPTIAYHALSLAIPAIAGGCGFVALRHKLGDATSEASLHGASESPL